MCTRFLLLRNDYHAVLERLGIAAPADFVSRYNLAPGGPVPGVRIGAADARAAAPVTFHWGLTRRGAADGNAAPVVNARAETLAERPMFRDAVRRRRGVLPASGYYEWRHVGRAREPWLFRRRDEQPFALAVLWEEAAAPDGTAAAACAVVTTAPNTVMQPIHHRMPVTLTPAQCARWLDPAVTEVAALAPLLAGWPAEELQATAVSRRVNNVRHDDPACLAPASADAAAEAADGQLGLGW